jgi:hypothetical protein
VASSKTKNKSQGSSMKVCIQLKASSRGQVDEVDSTVNSFSKNKETRTQIFEYFEILVHHMN